MAASAVHTPAVSEEELVGLANVQVVLAAGTGSSVVVNGQDISNVVRRIVVEHRAGGEIPVVFLELLGRQVDIVGEGVVKLESQGEVDADEVLEAFVAAIDAEELEARALSGMGGLGAPESTGQSFLRALKEMAGVDDNGT